MKLVEIYQIVEAFAPVDTQSGDNEGDWVSLKNFDHLTVIFHKKAGVAGDDPILQLTQGLDASGTTPLPLTIKSVYQKQGTQTITSVFTEVVNAGVSSDLSKYKDTDSAEAAGVYVIEVDAEELAEGYSWVQFRVADTGSAGAQLAAAEYILSRGRYVGKVANMPSAIV